MPFISVVVPAFNEEKYIGNTLRALKNQDYVGKYEIIVVDGMSRDDTPRIAESYADRIIRMRRGIAAQRNAGARAANGEILLFVDADTILLFNALSEFARAFRSKRVVGAACPLVPLSPKLRFAAFFWFFNRYVKASIKRGKARVAGACCAYREDVFEEVGGFNERMKTYEDMDLSERISERGRMVFVEGTLALTSVRRLKAWGASKAAARYLSSHLRYLLTGEGMKGYRPVR